MSLNRRPRSRKPRRPLHSVPLGGPMYSEHFSTDSDVEELEWARTFIDVLGKQGGPTYKIGGRAPEPGDALLVRGGDEPDVYLQITEAADQHRVAMAAKRDRYTEAMWRAAPRMKADFKGLQLFLEDCGRIGELLQPNTPEGEAFVRLFARATDNSVSRLMVLPVDQWTSGILKEASTGVDVHVRVHRYAADGPAKWLWAGPVRILDGAPMPDYIRDVVLKKLKHPECLKYKGANPLWLLVFTRDCHYDIEQERAIQADAGSGPNPFERIYLLRRL